MAVGDFIIGTITAVGTDLIYQPSGSNVIMVTTLANYTTNCTYTNGVSTTAYIMVNAGGGAASNMNTNSKIFINNTTFLRLINSSYEHTFSGVQVA